MGSQLQTRLSSTQDVLQACPTRCPLLLDLLLQQCQRGRHGGRRRHRPASVHAVKLNPAVTKLALYDIVATPGVAADLSHIETPGRVSGFVGADQLEASLVGAEIVVIPAGVPRKPGMTRDD